MTPDEILALEGRAALGCDLREARARAEQAEAQAAAMRLALRLLEWAGVDDSGRPACPLCHALPEPGEHAPQCLLATTLASDAGRAMLERARKLERVVVIGRRLLTEYEREEEEHGFPFDFALRQAHREFREALADLEADDASH